jgi:hypothetical protein
VLPGVRQPKDAAKREDGPLFGALAFLPFILRAPLRRSQIVPPTCFVKLGGEKPWDACPAVCWVNVNVPAALPRAHATELLGISLFMAMNIADGLCTIRSR